MADTGVLTAADIARLAGVTRGTVSNWRRRHSDFPAPVGGTDASPAYDRAEVEAWLTARGTLPEPPQVELLWRAVLDAASSRGLPQVLGWVGEVFYRRSNGEPEDGTWEELGPVLDAALNSQDPYETVKGLLDRYADSCGVSVTPQPLASLMADIAEVAGGDVFDPACGTGELLDTAVDLGAGRAYGQELDAGLAPLAAARVDFGDSKEWAEVEAGDSLRDDKFPDLRVRTVLCHPPFGDRDWGAAELTGDPRWAFGVPPKSEPELAWVQHALAHLAPGGRAVIVTPPAAATRPSGRRIRAELLRRSALRAVIAMPAGSIQPRHVPVHLWVLEQPGGQGPVDPRVLFFDDLAGTGRPGRASSDADVTSWIAPEAADDPWPDFSRRLLTAWRMFNAGDTEAQGEPGSWQVVRAIDLLDEAVDLTPARYVAPAQLAKTPARTADDIRALRARLQAALDSVRQLLLRPGEDWQPSTSLAAWNTATVAQLARSRMLEYLTGGQAQPVAIHQGDVLVPGEITDQRLPVVADEEHEGLPLRPGMHLIRADAAVMDSWFLAGVLSSPSNIQRAGRGTSVTRSVVRRLSVPLPPLGRQQRYGEIFRRLRELDDMVTDLSGLTGEFTSLLTRSLADGVLEPAEREGGNRT